MDRNAGATLRSSEMGGSNPHQQSLLEEIYTTARQRGDGLVPL